MLSEAECWRLLGSATIGRVAVTVGALPAVFPVNFALVEDAIVFRTGQGTKLSAALRGAVVSFQADAIDPTYHEGWSVMAVGKATTVMEPDELEAVARVGLTPWAHGTREHVVRIRPELLSGRRITHSPV